MKILIAGETKFNGFNWHQYFDYMIFVICIKAFRIQT
jgi:hypothetical protein